MLWRGSSYSEHVFRYIDEFIIFVGNPWDHDPNIPIEWLPLVYTSSELLTSLSCFTSFLHRNDFMIYMVYRRFYNMKIWAAKHGHGKIGFSSLRLTWLVFARSWEINKKIICLLWSHFQFFFFSFFPPAFCLFVLLLFLEFVSFCTKFPLISFLFFSFHRL